MKDPMTNDLTRLDAGLLERATLYYNKTGSVARLAAHISLSYQDTLRLVSTPLFQATIDKALRVQLKGDAAVSRRLLRSQVLDRHAHPKIRQDAAKHLTALGGFVAPKASDNPRAPDSLAEMSSDQLRAFLGKIEGELAERSAPVDAQVVPSEDDQVIDML